MTRAASKKQRPGKVSIIGSDDDELGWRITGDDGNPLKPRFGTVIVHGARADAVKWGISTAAIQRVLKAMKDRKAGPMEKGHRPKTGYGAKAIRSSGRVGRIAKMTGSAVSRSSRNAAKELD